MSAPTKQDVNNVRNAIDRFCNTIINYVLGKTPSNTVTRTVVLTGTLTALPAEDCIMIEIFNSDTTAVTVQANGGSNNLLPENSYTPYYTNNTNTILVSGTGTLTYTVVK
jgi:hypothetical protein